MFSLKDTSLGTSGPCGVSRSGEGSLETERGILGQMLKTGGVGGPVSRVVSYRALKCTGYRTKLDNTEL